MKWFKHYSDSYLNLKHQQVLAQFGLEGYGFFWVCVELVAQQGDKSRIKSDKNWLKALCYTTRVSEDKAMKFLNFFGDVKLIDQKALENKDLFIPKLGEYGDEYTDKVRRMSRHSRDNVGLDKIRIEENRLDKNRLDEMREFFAKGKSYSEYLELFGKTADKGFISREFDKFILYWTEPNRSGTKVRWEQQPTFEVKRRLLTWLNRSSSYQGLQKQPTSIVGL